MRKSGSSGVAPKSGAKKSSRPASVICGLLLVASVGMTAGAGASRGEAIRVDCGWFDDWKDHKVGAPDGGPFHAGMGGGLAAIEAAFGQAEGTYQQIGSQTGDNYHDWGEAGLTGGSHSFCGDSTYYPYFEG